MSHAAIPMLLVSLGLPVGNLDAAALHAWFLAKYVPASAALEDHYSRLAMQALIEDRIVSAPPKRCQLDFTKFGDRCRLDVFQSAGGERTTTMIAGDNRGIIVRHDDSRKNLGLQRVESIDADKVHRKIRFEMRLPFAPWCFGDRTIRDHLLRTATRITRITFEDSAGNGRVCVVDWESDEIAPGLPRGRFRFAMDRAWVLLSAEQQTHWSNLSVICCEYDHEIAGIPMIRVAELWHSDHKQGKPVRTFYRTSCQMLTRPPDVFDVLLEQVTAELTGTKPMTVHWQRYAATGMLGVSLLAAIGIACSWWGCVTFGPGNWWRGQDSDAAGALSVTGSETNPPESMRPPQGNDGDRHG